MRVLLLDNYDSFTHILARYMLRSKEVSLDLVRNDRFIPDQTLLYDAVVISPGPGVPSTSGCILEVIQRFSGQVPILGVCLGLQAICEAFGGQLTNLSTVQHGVTSQVTIQDDHDLVLNGLPSPFSAGRYHSWVCDPVCFPQELTVTAKDESGEIMAARHREHHTYGVQFHPESILTPDGYRIINNFLFLAGMEKKQKSV